MMTTTTPVSISFALLIAVAACASPRTAAPPDPVVVEPSPPPAPRVVLKAPLPPVNPGLPPVPHVAGPLEIKIVYPPAGQTITSRDSNFVFGSVGNGDAGLMINGVLTPVWPNGSFMAWLANPPADAPQYDIVATTETDSARLTHPIKLLPPPRTDSVPPDSLAPRPDSITPISPARWAALIGPAAYASDTDRVVTGYARTGGIQRWFLLPGTRVRVTGTRGTDSYVELDSASVIRIASADLAVDSAATPPVALRASAFTMTTTPEWTDVVIPVNGPPPYLVETDSSGLTLTLYGTSGPRTQATRRGTAASHVRSVSVANTPPQMKYTFATRGPVYGYQPLWESGKFILRVRKPPVVDSVSPLRGLTITLDAGHPPAGARGPTGFWEPEATLPIAFKTQELLQEKGVNVIMTRTSPEPVDLNLRPAIARRANSHAFVSIHLNAVPDGMNPFRAQGTATYHYHPHSGPLAEFVQRAAVQHMSLPDNGVKRDNFAVVRGTWMPSVLVEGAFMIMPDQEAALRTPEYQERYARSIVEGLEAYFRTFPRR
jgi:N-acetylmuramoyl-L-alanine amidase